jgi:hypothetical protein
MLQTLEEFLMDMRWPSNAYVKETGFKELYVRISHRFLEGAMRKALDIARVAARQKGKGRFTALVNRLREKYPDLCLYVECVESKVCNNADIKIRLQSLGTR